MKRGRYAQVEVEMIPRNLLEVCYRRTSPIVRSFDGTQFNMHDLAVWCYSQGCMDALHLVEQRPELLNPTTDFQI